MEVAMKYSLKSVLVLITLAALLVSIACSSQSTTSSSAPSAAPAFPASKSMSADRAYAPEANGAGGSGETSATDRKIVRTGSITMAVGVISKSQADITAMDNCADNNLPGHAEKEGPGKTNTTQVIVPRAHQDFR